MEGTQKRPHGLHVCGDAAAFAAAFRTETGRSIADVVEQLCGSSAYCGVVLGGSIPLGLGTPVSDIDLLILLDEAGAVVLPKPDSRGGIVFSAGFVGGGGRLEVGEVVSMLNGVEVNSQLLSAAAVEELARRVAGARVSLTAYEIGLLSRIKTGWVLLGGPSFEERCGVLLKDDALEIHAATWYLVGAVQDLEDGRAALMDSPTLALHLGRSCAERAFLAYFASRGYAYLGAKWLRALEPDSRAVALRAHAALLPGGEDATALLFPQRGDLAYARAYLDRVAGFAADLRRAIEQDRTYRIAFGLCPQLRSSPA